MGTGPPHTLQPVPWINFKEFWLEQTGFSIDTPVKIQVKDGCLVLTPVAEEAE